MKPEKSDVLCVFDDALGDMSCALPFMFDAFPSPCFLLNSDLEIVAANSAAIKLSGVSRLSLLRKKTDSLFNCGNVGSSSKGCSLGKFCGSCILQRSIEESVSAFKGGKSKVKLGIMRNDEINEFYGLITTAHIAMDGQSFCLLVIEDISDLAEVQGILPICSYCKKIRHDDSAWEQMEGYLTKHHDLAFSHGICPACLKVQMEELENLKKEEEKQTNSG